MLRLRAVFFGALWLGFVVYALRLSPPDDPALTARLVRAAFTLRRDGLDPLVFAVFMTLGVVPWVYAAMLVPLRSALRPPAWPFVLAMLALGGFALLPWLALARARTATQPESRLDAAFRARWLGALSLGAIAGLLGWGAATGDFALYTRLFHTNRLVHVMTLDLALCGLLMPYTLSLCRQNERVTEAPPLAALSRLPLLGGPIWCMLARRRPR